MAGYRALLIGNSTFPNDSQNLQSLEGPAKDPGALEQALTDPDTGIMAGTDVKVVPERTMAEILMEMEEFFSEARRDDVLLLYYSGHGLLDQSNQLHLCARDSRTNLLQSTTVSARDVNAMIDGSRAATTVIILDCCYSGSFKSGQLTKSLTGSGRFLLTSCRGGELANDATQENGTSLFTQHLVDALRVVPDRDGDGFVDLSDVYDYVYEALAAAGRQLPQRSFAGGGDVQIARRSVTPAAAPPSAPPAPDRPPPAAGPPPGERPPTVVGLSQSEITVRGVRPGEALPRERVFVSGIPGGSWTVETEADWLTLVAQGDSFTVDLRPQPGVNRANVFVIESATRATAVLKVLVEVDALSAQRGVEGRDGGPGMFEGSKRRLAVLGAAAAVVVLVLIAAALAGGGEGGDDGGGQTVTTPTVAGATVDHITVPGTQAWTDTGLDVTAGTVVRIEATDEVAHFGDQYVGPDGAPDTVGNQNNVLADANHAALIGRFGENGEPFLVGSSWVRTIDQDAGRLYLGVNDKGLDNNAGAFLVAVTRESDSSVASLPGA